MSSSVQTTWPACGRKFSETPLYNLTDVLWMTLWPIGRSDTSALTIITKMLTVLKRVDPVEHVDRWYTVLVQPTLFEPVAVTCAWGNRQTAWQRMRIFPSESLEDAMALAEEIVAQKIRQDALQQDFNDEVG